MFTVHGSSLPSSARTRRVLTATHTPDTPRRHLTLTIDNRKGRCQERQDPVNEKQMSFSKQATLLRRMEEAANSVRGREKQTSSKNTETIDERSKARSARTSDTAQRKTKETRKKKKSRNGQKLRGGEGMESGEFCTLDNFWSTASSSKWDKRTMRGRVQRKQYPDPLIESNASPQTDDLKLQSRSCEVSHTQASTAKTTQKNNWNLKWLLGRRGGSEDESLAVESRRSSVELLVGYDKTILELCSDMDSTLAGDLIVFSVYVLEPGDSSKMVLAAMRRAAERGVSLQVSVDDSLSGRFARWCEQTQSNMSDLQSLADDMPSQVQFRTLTIPSHCKYMLCLRQHSLCSAIFGGINIGDRFTNWEDFAVRIEGNNVVGCLLSNLSLKPSWLTAWVRGMSLSGEGAGLGGGMDGMAAPSIESRLDNPAGLMDPHTGEDEILFVTNRPKGFRWDAWIRGGQFPGIFNLQPCMDTFFQDNNFKTYTVAMAYLDSAGAAILSRALVRGASITLIMPTTPNVYEDSNLKALVSLMHQSNSSDGKLNAYMYPGMLHAKAIIGTRGLDGEQVEFANSVSMIGSCNFKTRSFHQFSELNAVIVNRDFNCQLQDALESIVGQSKLVTNPRELKYRRLKANIEEWLG